MLLKYLMVKWCLSFMALTGLTRDVIVTLWPFAALCGLNIYSLAEAAAFAGGSAGTLPYRWPCSLGVARSVARSKRRAARIRRPAAQAP